MPVKISTVLAHFNCFKDIIFIIECINELLRIYYIFFKKFEKTNENVTKL